MKSSERVSLVSDLAPLIVKSPALALNTWVTPDQTRLSGGQVSITFQSPIESILEHLEHLELMDQPYPGGQWLQITSKSLITNWEHPAQLAKWLIRLEALGSTLQYLNQDLEALGTRCSLQSSAFKPLLPSPGPKNITYRKQHLFLKEEPI